MLVVLCHGYTRAPRCGKECTIRPAPTVEDRVGSKASKDSSVNDRVCRPNRKSKDMTAIVDTYFAGIVRHCEVIESEPMLRTQQGSYASRNSKDVKGGDCWPSPIVWISKSCVGVCFWAISRLTECFELDLVIFELSQYTIPGESLSRLLISDRYSLFEA